MESLSSFSLPRSVDWLWVRESMSAYLLYAPVSPLLDTVHCMLVYVCVYVWVSVCECIWVNVYVSVCTLPGCQVAHRLWEGKCGYKDATCDVATFISRLSEGEAVNWVIEWEREDGRVRSRQWLWVWNQTWTWDMIELIRKREREKERMKSLCLVSVGTFLTRSILLFPLFPSIFAASVWKITTRRKSLSLSLSLWHNLQEKIGLGVSRENVSTAWKTGEKDREWERVSEWSSPVRKGKGEAGMDRARKQRITQTKYLELREVYCVYYWFPSLASSSVRGYLVL